MKFFFAYFAAAMIAAGVLWDPLWLCAVPLAIGGMVEAIVQDNK